MFDKFRRKLAKAIAPKPKKRIKKEREPIEYIAQYKAYDQFINDTSYRQYKRNRQADSVIGE